MAEQLTHYIKHKHESEKRWSFMSANGGTSYLRVHAARFTEENAKRLVAENAEDNQDFEFKIVPIDSRKGKPK